MSGPNDLNDGSSILVVRRIVQLGASGQKKRKGPAGGLAIGNPTAPGGVSCFGACRSIHRSVTTRFDLDQDAGTSRHSRMAPRPPRLADPDTAIRAADRYNGTCRRGVSTQTFQVGCLRGKQGMLCRDSQAHGNRVGHAPCLPFAPGTFQLLRRPAVTRPRG